MGDSFASESAVMSSESLIEFRRQRRPIVAVMLRRRDVTREPSVHRIAVRAKRDDERWQLVVWKRAEELNLLKPCLAKKGVQFRWRIRKAGECVSSPGEPAFRGERTWKTSDSW